MNYKQNNRNFVLSKSPNGLKNMDAKKKITFIVNPISGTHGKQAILDLSLIHISEPTRP